MSKQQFDVNYWGLISTTQQFFPLLRAGKGTIVNIGSAVNFVPGPYTSSYRSTKAAVEVLSHAMRAEMEPFGVHVVHVSAASFDLPSSLFTLIKTMLIEPNQGKPGIHPHPATR
jgi:short-subunit dehydrogenase